MGVTASHCKADDSAEAKAKAEDAPTKATKEDVGDAKDTEKEEDAEEAEEGGSGDDDAGGDEEEEEPKIDVEVKSSPYDPRFPTTNQARHCYTRYNEFHRCAGQKSEDDEECKFYQRAYRSICPGEWVEKWNEQRENGNWAGKY